MVGGKTDTSISSTSHNGEMGKNEFRFFFIEVFLSKVSTYLVFLREKHEDFLVKGKYAGGYPISIVSKVFLMGDETKFEIFSQGHPHLEEGLGRGLVSWSL